MVFFLAAFLFAALLIVTLSQFAFESKAEDVPASPPAAPMPADEAAQAMRVPDGFHVSLFASEPNVVQPISFCVDDRGRIFVAEALNYGKWRPEGRDRIVILADTDDDGLADSRKVFYEGLNYVTGIERGFGGVWAISPPSLYFIPDRNNDDVPDGPPEVVLDGFGHDSAHNLVNGFTWGPDGWLYGGHGRTSPSLVGKPGTKKEERIVCDGGVYRIHPTRRTFEIFADGTTNPWGVDFDDFGQCFVSNCVTPHLYHMIQGGHYEPWRGRASSLYAYERIATIADHLHYPEGPWQASRGSADSLPLGGGHAHCGTFVYLGNQFPKQYRNTVMMGNIHGKRFNNDPLELKGSGYVAHHGKDFAFSADSWFMPVTIQSAPDGSVYFSDWSDTGECHTYKPNLTTGRIFRVRYGDAKLAKVSAPHGDLALLRDEELIALQASDNEFDVRHGRRLLQERAESLAMPLPTVHSALRAMLAAKDQSTAKRLRALWALHATGGTNQAQLLSLLKEEDAWLRAWSVQLIYEWETPIQETSDRLAFMAESDPSPVVRRFIASAAQRMSLDARLPILRALVAHAEDKNDANLPLLYWYAIEPIVAKKPDAAIELLGVTKIPLVRQFIARRIAER